MIFEDMWKKQMFENLSISRPDVDPSIIHKLVKKHWDKKFTDHQIDIYNSYEETIQQTNLSSVMDIAEDKDLILTPAGVLFMKPGPGVERNLNAEVQAYQLDTRAVLKKQMFNYLESKDYIMARMMDAFQAMVKKQANSGFGITNNPYSFIYSFNASSAITAMGRALTALSSQVYEGTIGDMVKFHNFDELLHFVRCTMYERKDRVFYVEEIINKTVTRDMVIKRLLGMFKRNLHVLSDEIMIARVTALVDGMNEEEQIRVYYKNNLREFVKNRYVKKLFYTLAANMRGFVNPNEPPKEYLAEMVLLRELMLEFVTWSHIPFRHEDRARHEERAVTVLMDTDSNMNYYGKIRDDLLDYLLDTTFIHKSDIPRIKNNVLNMVAYIATGANKITIDKYLEKVNSVESERHRVEMKNEFYFPMLVITSAKKSYYASVGRKEGKVYDELELEVKGVSFFKSSATPQTSEFIYNELLFKEILAPESGKISIIAIKKKIENYKRSMIEDVKSGNLAYYKKVKVKTAEAYKDPMSIQAYKATWVWNQIAGETEKIELPGMGQLIKIKLDSTKDLAKLEAYPEIYEKFLKIFEENIEIGGGYADVYNEKTGKYENKKIPVKGINSICIPLDMEEMPEWLLGILDISSIIGNNMSLFKPIYTPLVLTPLETSSKMGKNKYYTNIIKIA